MRSAEVGHDFASERVERFDSLCQVGWAGVRKEKSAKSPRLIGANSHPSPWRVRIRKKEETHRERRIVVPRRVMQRPPQQCRSVLGLATLLAAERPRRQLDRRARLSLPGHFALERERRVRDGGILRVRAGEEPGGDKVLCAGEVRLQRSAPRPTFRHGGNVVPVPLARKTGFEKAHPLCTASSPSSPN